MSNRTESSEQLSKSWGRKSSMRQAGRISSADHVITVSDPSRRSAPPSPPQQQRLGTPPWEAANNTAAVVGAALAAAHDATGQAISALQQQQQQQDDSSSSTPADEESLATPLLQAQHNSQQQQDHPDDNPFAATVAARAQAAAVAAALLEASTRRNCRQQAGSQQQQQQQGNFKGSLSSTAADRTLSGNDTPTPRAATEGQRFQRKLAVAYSLSWAVNILLLVAKLYAYWISQSKAVLASAADSAVDLVSQVVIAYADWKMKTQDPLFPVGQARLEAIGVLACACIMSVASFEVINESVQVLIATLTTGELPELHLGLVMYLVLGSATGLKLLCWAVCAALQSKSDSMLALAEDHLNDIMSNLCAIITAVLAGLVPAGWWIDPTGAVAISLYIVVRWLAIAKQQVDKIVGRGAPDLFIRQLESLANSHHAALGLDVIRAYHFGARYIVEMEVVLPADMSVRDSHDISLDLQHKVELLDEVERAFVHVDYMRRDGLEHKVERELALANARSTSIGSGSRHSNPGVDPQGLGAWEGGSSGNGNGVPPGQQGAVEALV